VVGVLHARDVGELQRTEQMRQSHVAERRSRRAWRIQRRAVTDT
jgi:hypothetical protein